MYSVILSNKAKKRYEELEKEYFDRFFELFSHLEIHPYPAQEYDFLKLGGMSDCYRIRIGEYRVSYNVNTANKTIYVFELERRGRAYK